MVILTLLVFTLNLAISNKRSDTKECEINDNRLYGIIVAAMVGISIIIDFAATKFSIPIFVYLILAIGETFYFIFENTKRENEIKKKHKEMKQIFQCLSPVLKLPKDEDFDLEGDYGFEMMYNENGELNRIECEMVDPEKWEDSAVTRIVMNLNKYMNTKKWTSQVDYPSLKCTFDGSELPPSMAKYPGSWLRPWNFIPLGIDGNHELGLNFGCKEKEVGESSFVYEDGRKAITKISPKIAQTLVCGSTGGGKAIVCYQNIVISGHK